MSKMRTESEEVCQLCHDRPATRKVIDGITGSVRALCSKCFEKSAAPEESLAFQVIAEGFKDATCDYCGAPAVGSATYSEPSGQTSRESWCVNCLHDLADFNRDPENAIPELDIEHEDEATLDQEWSRRESRDRRKEEFMRQRVKARRTGGSS